MPIESDILFGVVRPDEIFEGLPGWLGASSRLKDLFMRNQVGHFMKECFRRGANLVEKIGEFFRVLRGLEAAQF